MVDYVTGTHLRGPLQGVKIADFGVGMAAALVAKFLHELGAEVYRMAIPDDEAFDSIYPAHKTWRSGALRTDAAEIEDQRRLIASADICIVGGEARDDARTQLARDVKTSTNPRLIIASITASLVDADFDPAHGADILVQARAGLVFEAYPDRPALLGFVPSAYGAALNALIGISTSLYRREADGIGHDVDIGLLEGAMSWPLAFWGDAEITTPRYAFRAPKGARALIFPARDGVFVQIVLGSAGAKYNLYRVLGIVDEAVKPGDAGMPNPADGPENYFGDVDRIAPYVALRDSGQLIADLEAAGVICEIVNQPAQNWNDPQIACNDIISEAGGVQYVRHPVNWSPGPGKRIMPSTGGAAPLQGIRVVDFGAFVAGPMVATGLADLGAAVIKIEPPRGDPLRSIYRFYIAANRGKRSIAIEMKVSEGLKLAQRLAREADIVCSNYRLGVAERFGIDAATLIADQPEKIVVTNAGYGSVGPKATNPAFDPCIQAMCGLEARAGGRGNTPILNPMMMTDICGGLLGQISVLVALYRRAKDGGGAAITVPLLNAGLFLLSDIVIEGTTARGPIQLLPDQTGYHATEKLYRTQDGYIAVAARDERSAAALAAAFGVDLPAGRCRDDWDSADIAALSAAIVGHTSEQALAMLAASGVPAEDCRRDAGSRFLGDDRHIASGLVYQDHCAELGRYRGLGRLFRLDQLDRAPSGRVSARGADTREILTELGLGAADIAALLSGQVVFEDRSPVAHPA